MRTNSFTNDINNVQAPRFMHREYKTCSNQLQTIVHTTFKFQREDNMTNQSLLNMKMGPLGSTPA